MPIRYVVFDWDGTLADTYPVISKAYQHTFHKLNMPEISYDEIKRLTSTLANKDTLGFIFGEQKEVAKKIYYDYIIQNHTNNLNAMPHAEDLLKFCHDSQLTSFLLSNKQRPYLLAETTKLGFTKYFSKIIAAGDCEEDKPHPKATHALFDSDLPDADSILVVGDGFADYKTARTFDHSNKSSLCVIYDPSHSFSEASPDYYVDNLLDIVDILTQKGFSHD